MILRDYVETRAALAVSGLTIITILVAHRLIGDTCFATCFTAIMTAFTAHSLLDDKIPDTVRT